MQPLQICYADESIEGWEHPFTYVVCGNFHFDVLDPAFGTRFEWAKEKEHSAPALKVEVIFRIENRCGLCMCLSVNHQKSQSQGLWKLALVIRITRITRGTEATNIVSQALWALCCLDSHRILLDEGELIDRILDLARQVCPAEDIRLGVLPFFSELTLGLLSCASI